MPANPTRPASRRGLFMLSCAVFGALALVTLSACGSSPKSGSGAARGHTETGLASYYADKFQSRQTASGERFDQGKLTAAHRKLPFGTRVRVTHQKTGKTVVVRINDRGPFAKGRIIDLSSSAFRRIAHPNDGVAPVRIEVLN